MRDDISIAELVHGDRNELSSLRERNLNRIWTNTLSVLGKLSREDFLTYGLGLMHCASEIEDEIFEKVN